MLKAPEPLAWAVDTGTVPASAWAMTVMLEPPHTSPAGAPSTSRWGGRVMRRWTQRAGWIRIVRNATIGYFEQAGSRMAAALAYYSIFVGGPVLVLTLALGSQLFGEAATRDAVAQVIRRILPPGATGAADIAQQMIQTSIPAASLAVTAGLLSLFGFARALATCLNVTLRSEGTEPFYRPFLVGPLLVLAVLGLLWGGWAFAFVVNVIEISSGYILSGLTAFLIDGLAPYLLATLYFAIILTVVPRSRLNHTEILVPAILGAALWESARHIFGWLMSGGGAYLRVFGPLGGVVALLGWVYVSSAILVITGQITWAYAMERRGRGRAATLAPREAGLQGWIRPFHGDNAVNEDYGS